MRFKGLLVMRLVVMGKAKQQPRQMQLLRELQFVRDQIIAELECRLDVSLNVEIIKDITFPESDLISSQQHAAQRSGVV